jgi:hypothetical protein
MAYICTYDGIVPGTKYLFLVASTDNLATVYSIKLIFSNTTFCTDDGTNHDVSFIILLSNLPTKDRKCTPTYLAE